MKNNILNNQFNRINFKYRVKKGYTSVIIPVYKDVVGLKDTLKSLKKQTEPLNNFEIIVANDGADNAISKLCKEFSVVEIKIKPNKGSYNARNKALEISHGEYIAFTDADVIVPKHWILTGKTSLKKYDYLGGKVLFPKVKKLSLANLYEKNVEFNAEKMYKEMHYFVTANLFIKKIIINNVGGFDRRIQSGGDNEFGNRIFISNKYTSFYHKELNVIHPYRDTFAIIKKMKRVIIGYRDLSIIYPKRYSDYKFSLIDNVIYTIKPPFEYFYSIKLFYYFWFLKFCALYLKIIIYKF